MAFVGDLGRPSTHKAGVSLRSDRHQRIGLIQVNPYRQHALWRWRVPGEGDASQQPATARDDGQAVARLRTGQWRRAGCGHGGGAALATGSRPDRERAVRTQVRVTPALADQQQGAGAAAGAGALSRLAVAACAGIRACRQSERRAGHLTAQGTKHVPVPRMVQGKCAQGLTIVIPRRRKRLLHALKGGHLSPKVGIIRQHDHHRAFAVHVATLPLTRGVRHQ
jgi:hypothetical protein